MWRSTPITTDTNGIRLRAVFSVVVATCVFTIGGVLAVAATASAGEPGGRLVLVGGGPTPAQVFEHALALSGGHRAVVAVLPQTYPTDSIADAAVLLWRGFGPREVVKVSRTDPVAARAELERATLIWMPGGFQGLLMRTIEGTPIPDLIRSRFAAGATIGGASAGAAAISGTMIADESTPDGNGIDGSATRAGLGLWPEAIVSPHFTERRRLGPLFAILQDHPTLVGVGIDEGTAVFVDDGQLTVMGRGTVTIVDAGSDHARTLRVGMSSRLPLKSGR